MAKGMGCYFHPEAQSVAQCLKCGKGICRNCVDRYSKAGDKYAGKCRDCVLEAGIECYNHSSKQAVALCEGCGKGLCRDCYDITGTWCHDCVKEMSDTTTGNVAGLGMMFKKEKTLMLVFSIIGFVLGLIVAIGKGRDELMIAGPWIGSGIGAAIAYFFTNVIIAFKGIMAEEGFVEAVKSVLFLGALFAVIGIFTGPIFTIVTVLRRMSWIKKCKKIITEEEETLKNVENILAGKQTNTGGVSDKVCQIINNAKLARNGVNLKTLKQMR
jgi:hypothetical protein